jgi:hypothetical protein
MELFTPGKRPRYPLNWRLNVHVPENRSGYSGDEKKISAFARK